MNATTPTTSRPRQRGGFTLIEAALTTCIVGLGTVAMMGMLVSGVGANQNAANLTTAVNLANNIHEMCDRLPFSATAASPGGLDYWGIPNGYTTATLLTTPGNVTWLSGKTFNPPVDAMGTSVNGMSSWTQVISVHSVNSGHITANADINNTATYPMSRITVTIDLNNNPVFTTSWVVAK